MNELFGEILNCSDCPLVDVITDDNQATVQSHIDTRHPGISLTAFVIAHRPQERQWYDQTYAEAKAYLDANFASRFLRHFDQSAWELCTYKFLVDNGIEVFPPTQEAGPDFDTAIGYVECIAITRGTFRNAIPYMSASVLREDGTLDGEITAQEVPTNAIKLRIASGFTEKKRKYAGYTAQNWFDTSKPRIIAINWSCEGSVIASDSRNIATNAALQALFGTGYPEIVLKDGEVIDERLSKIPVLKNANNSPVDVAFFAKPPEDEAHRIDGVILSSKNPVIYRPSMFRIVGNPFTNSMDIRAFSIGIKTITKLDESEQNIFVKTES